MNIKLDLMPEEVVAMVEMLDKLAPAQWAGDTTRTRVRQYLIDKGRDALARKAPAAFVTLSDRARNRFCRFCHRADARVIDYRPADDGSDPGGLAHPRCLADHLDPRKTVP